MNDIEQKALALLNEVQGSAFTTLTRDSTAIKTLCRAIEQHEAFRQEVSDAVVEYFGPKHLDVILAGHLLSRFIITKPKPDPLVRVINEVIYAQPHGDIDEVRMADDFRAALDAIGFEIREKNDV